MSLTSNIAAPYRGTSAQSQRRRRPGECPAECSAAGRTSTTTTSPGGDAFGELGATDLLQPGPVARVGGGELIELLVVRCRDVGVAPWVPFVAPAIWAGAGGTDGASAVGAVHLVWSLAVAILGAGAAVWAIERLLH